MEGCVMGNFPDVVFKCEIEHYIYPNKNPWVQAPYLVHTHKDVYWCDTVEEVLEVLSQDMGKPFIKFVKPRVTVYPLTSKRWCCDFARGTNGWNHDGDCPNFVTCY